jgi:hypothetical protein
MDTITAVAEFLANHVSDGFLTGKRFLIHDRDPLAFRETRRLLSTRAPPGPRS